MDVPFFFSLFFSSPRFQRIHFARFPLIGNIGISYKFHYNPLTRMPHPVFVFTIANASIRLILFAGVTLR